MNIYSYYCLHFFNYSANLYFGMSNFPQTIFSLNRNQRIYLDSDSDIINLNAIYFGKLLVLKGIRLHFKMLYILFFK